MALNNDMPIRDPERAETDTENATEYRASQGGYYPVEEKPVPGTPQR
ncbi:hypothetical protein [Streptomyces sp. NPDC051684]